MHANDSVWQLECFLAHRLEVVNANYVDTRLPVR
jgi:hypothetical protein